MKKHQIAMWVMALLLVGAGCATSNSVLKAHRNGKGTSQVYSVNEEKAWTIAKQVFRWEGSDAIEEHRNEGYMLTSSGMNVVSYGAVMGAWVEPMGQESTKVTVISKRRLSINVATTMTEGKFHKLFAEAVEIVNGGQPLPVEAP